MKRLPLAELEAGRAAFPPAEHADVRRPRRRADCADVPRPCPFVSCRHHLYLDVSAKTGSIKVNFPDLEPHELAESCQLDVAERGGLTLERVGEIVNLTRERVRQLELQALARLGHSRSLAEIRELEGRDTKRRLPVVQEDDAGAIDSVDFDVDAFVDLEDD